MRRRTVQDAVDKLLVHMRERHGAGEAYAARFVPLKVHLRRRPIQADAHSLELARENGFVVLRLGGIKDLQSAQLSEAVPTATTRKLCCQSIAERAIRMRSALFATAMTWRPRPLPSEAPSMIPGKSRSCFGRCHKPRTKHRQRDAPESWRRGSE